MVNWAKANPIKALIGGVCILIILSGALFEVSAADGNPVPTHKTQYGWSFLMPDGTNRFCGRLVENLDTVVCQTEDQTELVCKYADPPVFFTDCKEESV